MLSVGDLVVVSGEPELVVGRIERMLELDFVSSVRILLYRDGSFIVRPVDQVAPCPVGTQVG